MARLAEHPAGAADVSKLATARTAHRQAGSLPRRALMVKGQKLHEGIELATESVGSHDGSVQTVLKIAKRISPRLAE